MMHLKGIYQHDSRDCGVACLATICGFYGLKVPLSVIRRLEKTDMNGSSIYGICEASKKLGINAEAYKGDIQELILEINDGKEIKLPVIAHMMVEEMYHFVVIKKLSEKYVWIFDPDKGNMKLQIEQFVTTWTGNIICFEPTKSFKKNNLKKGMYTKIFLKMKRYWKELLTIFVSSLVVTGVTVITAFLFQHIIDHFMIHTDYKVLEKITITCWGIVGLYIVRLGLYVFRGIVGARLSKKVERELLDELLENLLNVSMEYFDSRKNGEVLERLNDVECIKENLCSTIINITLELITAVVSGILICTKSGLMFKAIVLIIVVYTLEMMLITKMFYNINRKISQNHANMLSIFKETIDGLSAIRVFSIEKFIKKENSKKIEKLINANYENERLLYLNIGISMTIESIGTLFLCWCGFSLVIKNSMTIGNLLLIILLAQNILSLVRNFAEMQEKIQRFIVSIERLGDIDYKTKINSRTKEAKIQKSENAIEIQNVSFSYGYNDEILRNININIKKGSKIAFVGKSGSGKTTLVNLIMRLRDVEKGKILVNGENINDIEIEILHKKIAYIQQDTFLFSKTILDNLLLGRDDISDEKLKTIIRECKLEEIIEKKEEGIYTFLSENANNLSTGEKQRIGIARALLQNPEIIIFDEITSSLDANTEKEIMDMIYDKCKDITCVFIAHRMNTIKKCDEIFVFEDGRIKASGNTEEIFR